jgi:hypothetical protein
LADDAGALLVRSGLVTAQALGLARERVTTSGGTIGEQLVATGALGDDVLTDFYKQRLLVPQVNPNTLARLPAKVVAVIPSQMAIELRAIPVSLDKENNLTVAMSDPSDRHAVDEITYLTGAYVVRAVATQMQIAWCLAHYYGHVTALGQRLLEPTTDAPMRELDAAVDRPGEPEPTHASDSDGVPEDKPAMPRARSASGEIRVPGSRAASIKPPPDFEDESSPVRLPVVSEPSGPVISIEAGEPSGPHARTLTVPLDGLPAVTGGPTGRLRPAEPIPPELAARAGEVDLKSGPVPRVDLEEPRVVIAEELEEPAPVDPIPDGKTLPHVVPVLPSGLSEMSGELVVPEETGVAPQITVDVDEHSASVVIHEQLRHDSEPVLLERRRPSESEREVAAGADGADGADEVLELPPKRTSQGGVARRDRRTQLGIGVVAAVTRTRPMRSVGDDDPTRVDTHVVAPGDDATNDEVIAPPSSPDDFGDTRPPGPAVHVTESFDHDDLDDDWGPPGTTIPPPLLGAIPGALDEQSGIIPMPNIDSAPLMVAPPVAPEASRPDVSPQGLSRALEDATTGMLDLIRQLEHANERDQVVALMIAHLALTHRRAGFFAVRAGELSLFAIAPRPSTLPFATVRLDRPSTLQDVVGTRLPYRGPMHDDASRSFLAAVLGASPPEILLVPVALRERVVGVLFGEHRVRHTFDDQLALAARAAGQALERILKSRRS